MSSLKKGFGTIGRERVMLMMLEKWLSTELSTPNKVLDRDTWESPSDADRQLSRWHTGYNCVPLFRPCGEMVNTVDSKSADRKVLSVRLRPRLPFSI